MKLDVDKPVCKCGEVLKSQIAESSDFDWTTNQEYHEGSYQYLFSCPRCGRKMEVIYKARMIPDIKTIEIKRLETGQEWR